MRSSELRLHRNCAFDIPNFFTHEVQNTLFVIIFVGLHVHIYIYIYIYVYALEKAMREAKELWRKRPWGVQAGASTTNMMTNLRFADDVLLVGTYLHQVRRMLSDLMAAAKKVGLEVHPEKTKIINNGIGQGQRIQHTEVDGLQVEVLRREAGTMYLGRLLSSWDAHDTEINHRMRRAWAKFGAFKKELTDKGYSLFQRL